MSTVLKLISLPQSGRNLLVEATVLLWAIRIGLRLIPFDTFRRLLPLETNERAHGGRSEVIDVRQLAWAVSASGERTAPSTCLTRAITLQIMLARRGRAARLRIGVTKDDEGRFQAHAWVEHDGKVIIGGPGMREYTPLPYFNLPHA